LIVAPDIRPEDGARGQVDTTNVVSLESIFIALSGKIDQFLLKAGDIPLELSGIEGGVGLTENLFLGFA